MAQSAGVQRKLEILGHHSDDRVWTPIEIDRFAQYARCREPDRLPCNQLIIQASTNKG
jgi:hypothetical protein